MFLNLLNIKMGTIIVLTFWVIVSLQSEQAYAVTVLGIQVAHNSRLSDQGWERR